MTNREEIIGYVEEKYGVVPDYPWRKTPNYAILRHAHNRKWFGAIVDITENKLGLDGNKPVDALNLKCDPFLIISLRNEPGIFPAYHMNKVHWLTVLLSSSISKEKVCNLIDLSYELTK
jgi:predicted DNA-binding protein (MmcQ/YjbR family)